MVTHGMAFDDILVGQLPTDCTEDSIRSVFAAYGELATVQLLPFDGSPHRTALLRMAAAQAQWCLANLNLNIPLGLQSPISVIRAPAMPVPAPPAPPPPAPPPAVSTPDSLLIGGLPLGVSEDQLRAIFGAYGLVSSVALLQQGPAAADQLALLRMADVVMSKWLCDNMNGNIPLGLATPISVKVASANDVQMGPNVSALTPPLVGAASPVGASSVGNPTQQPTDNLFITGFPPHFVEENIRSIMGAYGTVVSVKVLPPNGKPDRAALVRMGEQSMATWLVENLHQNIPLGLSTPISVRYAQHTQTTTVIGATQSGRVRVWFEDRGMGFITPSGGGEDIFAHRSDIVDGESLVAGASVTFEPAFDLKKGKNVAKKVVVGGQGCGGEGVVDQYGNAASAISSQSMDGLRDGVVKVYFEDKGFGFIGSDLGSDVFCHRNAIQDDTRLWPEMKVKFSASWDAGKNKFIVNTCFTKLGGGASSSAAPCGAGAPVDIGNMPSGVVKAWFHDKGFGFIAPDDGSGDVFLNRRVIADDALACVGTRVRYIANWNPGKGKMNAVSVFADGGSSLQAPYGNSMGGCGCDFLGGVGVNTVPIGPPTGGFMDGPQSCYGGDGCGYGHSAHQGFDHRASPYGTPGPQAGVLFGIVRSWMEERGMGFILPEGGGEDVFVHRSALSDCTSLIKGARVTYELTWNAQKCKEMAKNVCSGNMSLGQPPAAMPASSGRASVAGAGIEVPPPPRRAGSLAGAGIEVPPPRRDI